MAEVIVPIPFSKKWGIVSIEGKVIWKPRIGEIALADVKIVQHIYVPRTRRCTYARQTPAEVVPAGAAAVDVKEASVTDSAEEEGCGKFIKF